MLTMTKSLPSIRLTLFCLLNSRPSGLRSSTSDESQFVFTTSGLCGTVPALRADPNIFESLSPSGLRQNGDPRSECCRPQALGKQRWACLFQRKAPG
jgi:hypothetical protein